MVIGRLVRSKEDLTIENRDLKSKLGLVAGICRGFTETETANQGHMINRDTQASIDSNMEGRARKRTRQATANRLQNRLPPHSRQDSQPHLQKISKSRDVMIW
ncbi:MAG: hypothetical protein CL912_02915 [Deltaproteobacteria bacterium]|nr:hypothetical protein [Deltaproteobacteria bacterium]